MLWWYGGMVVWWYSNTVVHLCGGAQGIRLASLEPRRATGMLIWWSGSTAVGWYGGPVIHFTMVRGAFGLPASMTVEQEVLVSYYDGMVVK